MVEEYPIADIINKVDQKITDIVKDVEDTFVPGQKQEEQEPEQKCEACGHSTIGCTMHMTREQVQYKLCLNCTYDLVNLCLTKEKFKNLIDAGHKDTEFYLHDDFYDEDGKAIQSKV